MICHPVQRTLRKSLPTIHPLSVTAPQSENNFIAHAISLGLSLTGPVCFLCQVVNWGPALGIQTSLLGFRFRERGSIRKGWG